MSQSYVLSLQRCTARCGCTFQGPASACTTGQGLFAAVQQAYTQVVGVHPSVDQPWSFYETQRAAYFTHLGEHLQSAGAAQVQQTGQPFSHLAEATNDNKRLARFNKRILTPGDMTRYATVYGVLTAQEDPDVAEGRGMVFFAFGLGDLPMVAYVFSHTEVSLYYFSEKFAGLDNQVAIRMGWLALLHVMGYPLPGPEKLGEGYEYWYNRLEPAWMRALPVLTFFPPRKARLDLAGDSNGLSLQSSEKQLVKKSLMIQQDGEPYLHPTPLCGRAKRCQRERVHFRRWAGPGVAMYITPECQKTHRLAETE